MIHYEKLKGLPSLKFDMKEGQPYEESLINAVFNVYTNAVKKGAIHIHELYFTNFVLGEPGGGTITWHLQKWEKLGGESSSAVYKPCTPTTVKLDEVFYTISKSKHQEMALKIVRALTIHKSNHARGGGPAMLEQHQEATDDRLAAVEEQGDATVEQADKMQKEIVALQELVGVTQANLASLTEKVNEMPNVVQVANPPIVNEMPTVVQGANLPMAEGPLDPPEEWMVAAEAVRVADAQAEAAAAAEAAEVAAAAEKLEAEEEAKEAVAVAAAADAKEAEEAKAAKAAEDKAAESAAKAAKAAEAKAAKSAAKTAKAAEAKAAKSAAKAPVEKPPSLKKVPKKRKPPPQEVSSEEETSERGWSCKRCTYDNGALFFVCAMCEEPRDKFHGGLIAKWKKLEELGERV